MIYRAGQAIDFAIEPTDENGTPLQVEDATFRVVDQTDTELQTGSADVGETGVVASVTAATNTLAVDDTRGFRQVIFSLVTPAGTVERIESYIIESNFVLEANVNSFQSLGEAELLASTMPELQAWEGAPLRDRKMALISAHARLQRLRYDLRRERDESWSQDRLTWSDPMRLVLIDNIGELTKDELLALPDAFVRALRRAQVIEADIILGGDLVARKRMDGLMSETVGESSQMFRPGKPLQLPISHAAMRELRGYVNLSVGVGRA